MRLKLKIIISDMEKKGRGWKLLELVGLSQASQHLE